MWKTPMIVLLWIAVLIVWGVGYYAYNIGKPLLGGDSRTAPEVNVSSAGGEGGSGINGKTVFNAQCAACHQANGQGVPGAFPRPAGSRGGVEAGVFRTAIVQAGRRGRGGVKGRTSEGMMPAFKGP